MIESDVIFSDRDRYCIGCGYNLRASTRAVCPECGRAFDPANYKSFLEDPPQRLRVPIWLGHRLGGLGILLGVLSLLYLPWLLVLAGWVSVPVAYYLMCGLLFASPLLFGLAILLLMDFLPDAIGERVIWTMPLGLCIGGALGLPFAMSGVFIGVVIGALVGPVAGLVYAQRRLSP